MLENLKASILPAMMVSLSEWTEQIMIAIEKTKKTTTKAKEETPVKEKEDRKPEKTTPLTPCQSNRRQAPVEEQNSTSESEKEESEKEETKEAVPSILLESESSEDKRIEATAPTPLPEVRHTKHKASKQAAERIAESKQPTATTSMTVTQPKADITLLKESVKGKDKICLPPLEQLNRYILTRKIPTLMDIKIPNDLAKAIEKSVIPHKDATATERYITTCMEDARLNM